MGQPDQEVLSQVQRTPPCHQHSRNEIHRSQHSPRLRLACIWDGTTTHAEFWHLLNACCHCSGRTSEVSLISLEDHSSVEISEDAHGCITLQLEIQRRKDGDLQDLAIHPFRDGLLEDCYFSTICLAVMNGCNDDGPFPSFSKAALATTKTGMSASKVSSP